MVDQKTISYYENHTEEFVSRTIGADMSFCRNKFTGLLPAGAYILDAGCGSGRDSRCFLEQGFLVRAMDASAEMCRTAQAYLGQPVDCMRFDELGGECVYDGVWACASLLHLKKSELPGVLAVLCRALKPGGILYASVKYGRNEEERLGRFFSDYSMEELTRVFLKDGKFELIECFETEDVGEDYKKKPWVNILVRKSVPGQ